MILVTLLNIWNMLRLYFQECKKECKKEPQQWLFLTLPLWLRPLPWALCVSSHWPSPATCAYERKPDVSGLWRIGFCTAFRWISSGNESLKKNHISFSDRRTLLFCSRIQNGIYVLGKAHSCFMQLGWQTKRASKDLSSVQFTKVSKSSGMPITLTFLFLISSQNSGMKAEQASKIWVWFRKLSKCSGKPIAA